MYTGPGDAGPGPRPAGPGGRRPAAQAAAGAGAQRPITASGLPRLAASGR